MKKTLLAICLTAFCSLSFAEEALQPVAVPLELKNQPVEAVDNSVNNEKALIVSYTIKEKVTGTELKVKNLNTDKTLSPVHFVPVEVASTEKCELNADQQSFEFSLVPTGFAALKEDGNYSVLITLNDKAFNEDGVNLVRMSAKDDICKALTIGKGTTVWLTDLVLKVGEPKALELPDGNEIYFTLDSVEKQ